MKFSISPEYMKAWEQYAFSKGVSSLYLMEKAARASFEAIKGIIAYPFKGKRILLVCGSGNNGGDGTALARMLADEGVETHVYILKEPRTYDAKYNLEKLKYTNAKILEKAEFVNYDLIVDAIFGTGLRGGVKGEAANIIHGINSSGVKVLSLDIPSGIDGNTGYADGAFVRANYTISFQKAKHGLFFSKEGAAGEIIVADIDLPSIYMPQITNLQDSAAIMQQEDFISLLPKRNPYSYKGDFGRVLLYVGSFGMAGAASMAALACIKSGAGLVYVLCEEKVAEILQNSVPNAMCVREKPQNINLFALGCGIEENASTWETILELFDDTIPSVWDAGALNLLAKNPIKLGERAIITPHIGEAARLLKCSNEDIQKDMFSAVKELYLRFGANVLLKGNSMLMYDGKDFAIQPGGVPALAKGGSGDALLGILSAIYAQQKGENSLLAMQLASYWLNLSGRYVQQKQGSYSPSTMDAVNSLGMALSRV